MNLRAYWRFVVVARQFLPLILAYTRDRNRFIFFGRSRDVSSEQSHERAKILLESLLTLGPTFIKLGQLLSTRPDILPPEYVEELSKLQDRVPPASWPGARAVIEEELGPVDQRFDDFDTDAISGASLGQVYRATADGQEVAVKVRRPGVEELVEADLRVLRWSIPLLMRFVDDARAFSLETVSDEFSQTIREEMDYRREAQMLTEIKENFAEQESIRIPDVIDSHSTGRVLTMEYVPGTKIDDIERLDEKNIDRSRLAETLQRAYLKMIIQDGVFHADPHPGNLAVQDDGTVVYYDFGMSGYVDPFVQDRIIDFYAAVASQDIDAILDTLVEMGTLSPDANRQVMSDVMELAIADARGEDIEQYRIQQIVNQVEDTIYEFPLRLPPNLALVLRVATVVEGVCLTLDPDFDFISVATGFLRDEGYLEEGAREFVEDRVGEVRAAAESTVRIPPKLERALDRVERENLQVQAELKDSENQFDRLAARLVGGMAFAAGVVSTSIFVAFSMETASLVAGAGSLVVFLWVYRSFRAGRSADTELEFAQEGIERRMGTPAANDDGDEGGTDPRSPPPDATTVSVAMEDAENERDNG